MFINFCIIVGQNHVAFTDMDMGIHFFPVGTFILEFRVKVLHRPQSDLYLLYPSKIKLYYRNVVNVLIAFE